MQKLVEKFNNVIPQHIKKVLESLREDGHQAYLVGGCVRDFLLGKTPKDYDVCTSATPDQADETFGNHTYATGLKHGTITLLVEVGEVDGFNLDFDHVEVTTMRQDGDYSDGRRPDEVIFTDDLYKDLSRRDFTMNAIAFDGERFYDPFDGKMDIHNLIVKAVGNPELRIEEDNLRMMRAIRQSAQHGMFIGHNLKLAIQKHSSKINNVSKERVRDELMKIIMSNGAERGIKNLHDFGIFEYILPNISNDYYTGAFKKFNNILNNSIVRLSYLFINVEDNEEVVNCLKSLKFDNKTIRVVSAIHKHYEVQYYNLVDLKHAIVDIGIENINNYIEIVRNNWITNNIRKIINEKHPLTIKDLKIDGETIMKELKIEQSPMVGKILEHLLDIVLEYPERNLDYELLEYSHKIYESYQ